MAYSGASAYAITGNSATTKRNGFEASMVNQIIGSRIE